MSLVAVVQEAKTVDEAVQALATYAAIERHVKQAGLGDAWQAAKGYLQGDTLKHLLHGAAAGGGIGLLSSLTASDPRRRRRPLYNAVTGALAGAAGLTGAGLLAKGFGGTPAPGAGSGFIPPGQVDPATGKLPGEPADLATDTVPRVLNNVMSPSTVGAAILPQAARYGVEQALNRPGRLANIQSGIMRADALNKVPTLAGNEAAQGALKFFAQQHDSSPSGAWKRLIGQGSKGKEILETALRNRTIAPEELRQIGQLGAEFRAANPSAARHFLRRGSNFLTGFLPLLLAYSKARRQQSQEILQEIAQQAAAAKAQ